jgi:acyl-CoA thioester hydrolase
MHYTYCLSTRYSDTAQDGIIHHSSYVLYLEEARIAFLKSLGFDINDYEKNHIISPVVDLYIKYLKPLHSSEEISIHIEVLNTTKVRFALGYTLFSKGQIVCKAQTNHCFTNTSFKPIGIEKALFEKLLNFKDNEGQIN